MSQATVAPPAHSSSQVDKLTHTQNDSRSMYIARIDQLRRDHASVDSATSDSHSAAAWFAGFFVMVFVFGQIMSQLALLSGHYVAWIAGLLFSLFGISIALGSLFSRQHARHSSAVLNGESPTKIRPAHAGYVTRETPKASA